MAKIIINTPRGNIVQSGTSRGKVIAKIDWDRNFGPQMTKNFDLAQKFVDSEVLRVTDPYVPKDTGTLIASGVLGTEIGSGLVQWIVPYAQRQYFTNKGKGLRGAFWFERAMIDHKQKIIDGAAKFIKGRYL